MGERTPLALLDAPASGRMAVAEAITNIAAADVAAISDVRLSANWMAACGEPGEDADLYATVKAVGEEFCPALGITIPVGKDSSVDEDQLERRRRLAQDGCAVVAHRVGVCARRRRAPHADAAVTHGSRRNVAAADRPRRWPKSHRRLVSCAGLRASSAATRRTAMTRRRSRTFLQPSPNCARPDLILAYHDRSDGGVFVTLAEMAFAGRCGLDVDLGEVKDVGRSAVQRRARRRAADPA